ASDRWVRAILHECTILCFFPIDPFLAEAGQLSGLVVFELSCDFPPVSGAAGLRCHRLHTAVHPDRAMVTALISYYRTSVIESVHSVVILVFALGDNVRLIEKVTGLGHYRVCRFR